MEIDEMEVLRQRRDELTQQLWGVMGDLQMARAKQAGHSIKKIPSPVDALESCGRGGIDRGSISEENRHAYMRNRFGTTSQQSWCTETITGLPQLNNTDRKHRRRVTDVSRIDCSTPGTVYTFSLKTSFLLFALCRIPYLLHLLAI
jgi:hypothetical protein